MSPANGEEGVVRQRCVPELHALHACKSTATRVESSESESTKIPPLNRTPCISHSLDMNLEGLSIRL